MLTSPRARAAAIIVLLAGLFGLAVWYGSLAPAPSLGAYPTTSDVGPNPDRYAGERVVLAGTAVGKSPPVVEVSWYDRDGRTVRRARYAVTGLDRPVEPGDGVWVYGVAGEDRSVRAIDAAVTPPEQVAYAYGVSLLAGVWVLARIVRDWRLDPGAPGLVPRPGRSSGPAAADADPRGGEDA